MGLLGEIDDPHAAFANLASDLVVAERIAPERIARPGIPGGRSAGGEQATRANRRSVPEVTHRGAATATARHIASSVTPGSPELADSGASRVEIIRRNGSCRQRASP